MTEPPEDLVIEELIVRHDRMYRRMARWILFGCIPAVVLGIVLVRWIFPLAAVLFLGGALTGFTMAVIAEVAIVRRSLARRRLRALRREHGKQA